VFQKSEAKIKFMISGKLKSLAKKGRIVFDE